MPIINFYVDDGYQRKQVSYDSSIIVKDFILDYLKKYNNRVTLSTNELIFRIGSKILNTPRFLDKKLEDILSEGAKVHFLRKQVIHDSGAIRHFDGSKYITKEFEPGYNNLPHRRVCNGLNIQSECCGDIIYVQIGYVEKWNINEQRHEKVICPCCKGIVKPICYWLKDCNYIIDYHCNIDGDDEIGSFKGKAKESGRFKIFSPNEYFFKLIFTVTKC